jgi:hypothetical protein
VHELVHALRCGQEALVHADAQYLADARGLLDDGSRFDGVGGERFFDEDVLAGSQRRERKRCVERVGRGDEDGIDVGIVEQRLIVGEGAHAVQAAGKLGQALGVRIADGHDAGVGVKVELLATDAADLTCTQNSEPKLRCHVRHCYSGGMDVCQPKNLPAFPPSCCLSLS